MCSLLFWWESWRAQNRAVSSIVDKHEWWSSRKRYEWLRCRDKMEYYCYFTNWSVKNAEFTLVRWMSFQLSEIVSCGRESIPCHVSSLRRNRLLAKLLLPSEVRQNKRWHDRGSNCTFNIMRSGHRDIHQVNLEERVCRYSDFSSFFAILGHDYTFIMIYIYLI